MVTYINTKNQPQYQQLFNKAQEVFKQVAADGNLPAGIDINTLEIASLNQYFAYLQDLIDISPTEDIKRYFTRLPLDEDFLEINANTRAIKIPTNFSRNGVGVQGDEMAEVVYFKIDRYFDAMDLASDDMHIIIQWEAKDKDKKTIAGISPNYGKDVETEPGKIIFGWPIYSELTQTPGTIKFAVRFYSVGDTDENGMKTLSYSLATLPAELTVGATLDYDLLNNSVMEIDRGKVITGRIKNSGIYDPSIPMPSEPIITTDLHVLDEDANIRIIDLPTDGTNSRQLAISAKPADIGAILYDWKQWPYDTETGNYKSAKSLTNANVDNGVYVEMKEDLGEDTYYKITSPLDASPVVYTPIVIDNELDNTEYNETNKGFLTVDGSYITLYKKLSVATVNETGIYTVNVKARASANITEKKMAETVEQAKAVGVKIPGPYKPVISDNTITHIIAENGVSTLTVSAVRGEEGKAPSEVGTNPQVTLAYNWKQVINGVAQPVEELAGEMEVSALPASQAPNDDNIEDAQHNQNNIQVVQKGASIMIYSTGELKSYTSTNPNQGTHRWAAIDIDTGRASIIGLTWNGQALTQEDVDEAASVGLGAGHIIYWANIDSLETRTGNITIGDTTLTFGFSDTLPNNVIYTFNEDKSEMTITGLPESGLDNTYVVDVVATRNGISTTTRSSDYRLTNAPEKPILKYRVYENGSFKQVEMNYQTETMPREIPLKKRTGEYSSIGFSVEPIAHSDNLSYVWMRINADPNTPTDWDENDKIKLQIDLDDFLTDLFEDKEGVSDYFVNGDKKLINLPQLGEVVDTEDNGPVLQLSESTPTGYYYCIVINELNDKRIANVTSFFHVYQ